MITAGANGGKTGERGLTFVELIVTVAILAILAVGGGADRALSRSSGTRNAN